MIETLIRFSVKQKLIVFLFLAGMVGMGIWSLQQLPIDAVPDITNNQVQVVTVSNSLAPQEVEQFITYPVEVAMANIPNVIEIRSISRFGLSVVTIVFEDFVPILEARQFVKEQIGIAEQEIPAELGQPELMPITTGLGEIYQYVLRVKPGYEHEYDAMKLRTIQDWIVKRQLAGITGIIEVSSFGGYLKQYEVAIDPFTLQSYRLSIQDVFDALAKNNQNSGGSYIEKTTNAYYIRTEGLVRSEEDIGNIVLDNRGGIPVLIKDVAKVQLGSPKRFGAMTMDGLGEAVGGITLMLKGANSSEAIANVRERVEEVKKSLPEGIELYPYLDRADLVAKTISTVEHNLLEGGLIVIIVLILLLGNWRAGIIVASIIPLAMLFALILMRFFGVSANLMSLGAIDFGIVVDGAVIIVEGVLFALTSKYAGQKLSQQQLDGEIIDASAKLFRSAVFGVFIILVVFIPIMTLTGIEGKMFRPMAFTFSFVVLGALILSLTYVPAMSALILPKKIKEENSLSDKLINAIKSIYKPTLKAAMRLPYAVLALAIGAFIGAIVLFRSMGAEFIPTLEEGDLAMQMTIQPGSSLEESVRTATKAEAVLLEHFPEVEHVVSKIGTAEVPTDPMAIEDGDIMIILKEKEEWTSASGREELVEKMKEKLEVVAGASFEFTQPIQLRFNELMTGAKTDIAVKVFGENTETLKDIADRAAVIIRDIQGAADVKVEQTEGLPQLKIDFNRAKIAEYGLDIEKLNTLVRMAYAGESAGIVFENERKFDLVVRLDSVYREDIDLARLFVPLKDGRSIPMSEVAEVRYTEGPMQISREDARRRINIGVNVRNRDVASLVEEIRQKLDAQLNVPPGYSIRYGGQFENLEKAQARLSVAVPLALGLIFILLYFTFGQLKYALMIFTAVPLSAIGGISALALRGMPFSISAGVGFIALFGVAVLNGIVLISYFNSLRQEHIGMDLMEVVVKGSLDRLRPVLMTATVAALGFLPMALSTSNGAEVQKPLATVVIGGLITATLLTLLLMPILYFIFNKPSAKMREALKRTSVLLFLIVGASSIQAQTTIIGPQDAIDMAVENHPDLKMADLRFNLAEQKFDQARRIPATDFSLAIGQTNTNLIDYNFSVTQGLGAVGADKKRKNLALQEIVLANQEKDVIELQLIAKVQKLWFAWSNEAARLRTLQAQQQLYESLREKAQLQFDQGEINRLQLSVAESKVMQIEQQLNLQQVAAEKAQKELAIAAWIPESDIQIDTSLLILPFPSGLNVNQQLVLPFEQQQVIAETQIQVSEKELAPQWNFGYFNQSIRPDYSLQGLSLGTSVPLAKKAGRAKIEEDRVRKLMADQRLEQVRQELSWEREKMERMARQYNDYLRGPANDLLTQARLLRNLAATQLQAGEIDFFQYLQSVDVALQNELEYLNAVNQYNQAVIDLRFLVE
jgi:cobalt-zinc-cadmium resistance protein CzcA